MSSIVGKSKLRLKIAGSRSSALDIARGRLALISVCFVLAYVIVLARIFDLSVIEGELAHFEYDRSSVQQDIAAPLLPRGNILDRNGVLLATSLKTASLFADPSLVADPAGLANDLVGIFPELKYGDVLHNLQRDGRFVWVKRNITPQEQKAVLQVGSPSLNFRYDYSRIYPQGALVSHIVGTTNVDGKGVSGIEASFNGFLSPPTAKSKARKVPDGPQDEPELYLTIDVRLQHALRREMLRAKNEFSAKAGAGLIFDVVSGEILAAVSLPDFDPHNAGSYRNAENNPLFNRVTLGVYEMGSTFKIFSTAAYLDTFNVSLAHKFDATKPIQRGRFKISDYHAKDRILSIPEVFMYSSNIGSALMGEELGTDRLRSFYSDLGLLNKASVEISEIGGPLVPDPWRDINTITASYGHGVAVSPLQLMVGASSIVNGGIRVEPTLIRSHEQSYKMPQKSHEVRVVSPQTAHRMRQLLRLVVTDGTGENADVEGYSVGGKTGTAEKTGSGGYDRKKLLSSFIGFFPMEEPRYGVLIVMDEPKGTKASFGYATGGWVSTPAVGHVIQSMAAILGIPANNVKKEEDIAASLKVFISDEKKKGAGH